jgi:hypothetical protein
MPTATRRSEGIAKNVEYASADARSVTWLSSADLAAPTPICRHSRQCRPENEEAVDHDEREQEAQDQLERDPAAAEERDPSRVRASPDTLRRSAATTICTCVWRGRCRSRARSGRAPSRPPHGRPSAPSGLAGPAGQRAASPRPALGSRDRLEPVRLSSGLARPGARR